MYVPSSLGPGVVAGSVTRATGIIIDSSTIRVRFTHTQYTGSEATGFVMVTLKLVGVIHLMSHCYSIRTVTSVC